MNLCLKLRYLAVWLLTVGVLPLPGNAQTLAGRVSQRDSLMPTLHVIIEIQSVGTPVTTKRLAATTGTVFRLEVRPGRHVVRVLRIGFEPRILDTLQLREGEIRPLDIVIDAQASTLPLMITREYRGCADLSKPGATAEAVQAIRGAMLVSILAAAEADYRRTARIMRTEYGVDSQLAIKPDTMERAFRGLHPSSARAVDDLVAKGLVVSVGKDRAQYAMPSLEYLTSDHFVDDYCFQMRPASRGAESLFQIAFIPRRNERERAPLSGAFTLTSKGWHLKDMSFHYTRRLPDPAIERANGLLTFHTLANGLVFVSGWKQDRHG